LKPASPELSRKHTQCGFQDSEFEKRFKGFERVGKKLAAIKNSRRTRAIEHIVRQNFRPEIFDFLRFRKKAMTSDIKTKTFVFYGSRNSADVSGVGFKNGYFHLFVFF
jgi:hypothetical protein